MQQMAHPSATLTWGTAEANLLGSLDRPIFALAIRARFKIAAPGLDTFLSLLCKDPAVTDPRWGVYILATMLHETAGTFRPLQESGHRTITWLARYLRISEALGIGDTLAGWPDRALQPGTAYLVLSCGMLDGLFTGRRVSEFISGVTCDYMGARQVVNALDNAGEIAANATTIEQLLQAAAIC